MNNTNRISENTVSLTERSLRFLPPAILSHRLRIPLLVSLHIVFFCIVYLFAFAARFDFSLSPARWKLLIGSIAPVVLTKLAVFYFGRHFHGWWRYVTFADLRSLVRVSLLSMVVVAFVDYFLLPLHAQIPRLTILLDTMCTILLLGGVRSIWRFADEAIGAQRNTGAAFMVGTNHQAGQLAAQINSSHQMPFRVTGLLANSEAFRKGAVLGDVRVRGHIKDVAALAKHHNVKELLVPAATLDGAALRKLIDTCNKADLNVRVLPRFEDAMVGTEKIPLRDLDINDLLKRDPVVLDTDDVESLITGKRVLVTGAGGSIGSEICRQLLKFNPAALILLGRGENRIYAIHAELECIAEKGGTLLHREIGDITDRRRMERLFREISPEIVFHAAAHKHVPLMELHPGEAVKNNVLGTQVAASLAHEFRATHFVMVSSDKAVNPTSVMGATKQLAERVVYDLAQISETKFATVRFGNVLGSAGSVIPRFQEQIRNGGPVTITDERMTRYFMSIPEASQLVIQSAAMCRGGEIYVLNMGKPVKICELAKDLIRLSGLQPGSIELVYTGIRPGEKLYEELYFDDDDTIETKNKKIRAAYPRGFQGERIAFELQRIMQLTDGSADQIRQAIAECVPSYHTPSIDEKPATADMPIGKT